jgi:hypothetical protein
MTEICLRYMRSIMSVFQSHLKEILNESNAVVEIWRLLFSIHDIFLNVKPKNICPWKLKVLLKKNA